MYKIVIADDEQRVRNGLKESVDWEKYNISVVATANNGQKALEIIKKEKPELILTDIYMPGIDGLELINRAAKLLPHCKSIIMSGYDDFNYAQTAIRYKAFDYILKPIDLNQIENILDKATKQIDRELYRIKNEKLLKKQLKKSIPFLKEKHLYSVLNNNLTIQEVKKQNSFLEFNFSNSNIFVMIVELDDSTNLNGINKITDILGIKKAINFIISNDLKGEVIEGEKGRYIIAANYNNKDVKFLESVLVTANRIKNQISNLYDRTVTIGIGRLYDDIAYISDSYQEALESLEYQIFEGRGKIIYIEDVTINNENKSVKYPIRIENKLTTAVKVGDRKGVTDYISQFISHYCQKNEKPIAIRRSVLQLCYALFKKIIEWDLSLTVKKDKIEDQVISSITIKELKSLLLDFTSEILDEICEKKGKQNNNYIKKAKRFIKKNYDQDISLQDIANSVYITPEYLANIFKKKTNQTIIDHLTEIRIKKAKKLLLDTNLKVYEIAEKVGYNNSRYFGRVFKKHVKNSASEYRKNGGIYQ